MTNWLQKGDSVELFIQGLMKAYRNKLNLVLLGLLGLLGLLVLLGCGKSTEPENQEPISVEISAPDEPTPDEATLPAEELLTSFQVKESAQVGAVNYPVSMVFPVEYGKYQDAAKFHIRNEAGDVIPAQFEVLNRWWGKDNSIRHLVAHFSTNVEAYQLGDGNSGVINYQLFAGEDNFAPNNAVKVTEFDNSIAISNSLIDIEIQKSPLKILTPAGELQSVFVRENGTADYSFSHKNIQYILEERGPLRSVIKIYSNTEYIAPDNIKHGWAMRLYIHANSPLVKVDFQLQNSALNVAISAPLYFKGHSLVLTDAKTDTPREVRAEHAPTDDIFSLPYGKLSTDTVNVFVRNFWQTFPNGIRSSNEGELSIDLWPEWSKQFFDKQFVTPELYWLDDMKQTYKEVLLDFSGSRTAQEIDNLSHTFQFPPVTVLPVPYYQDTMVTLDLGGFFPAVIYETEEYRTPQYPKSYYDINNRQGYRFGMDNFGLDTNRKRATSMAGGWPSPSRKFFVSGNPADYFNAQDFAKAEINIRPQWLTGFDFELHHSQLKLTTNPYAGKTWRRFLGHGISTSHRDYINGTRQTANPRDDQHAWFYHVEHAYLMSGNKWFKDWYQFMAEFKKVYLLEKDPWPDISMRAEGHSLSVALAAYQATGNTSLAEALKNYYFDVHSQYLQKPYYLKGKTNSENPKIAAFQAGYSLRALINIYNEFPADKELIELAKNYFDWNLSFSHFSYYKSIVDEEAAVEASPTSLTLVDPAIWFSMHLNEPKYAEHAVNYVEKGIGGIKPYGNWSQWNGQFESALYQYYQQHH